jgi:hypothetical protein
MSQTSAGTRRPRRDAAEGNRRVAGAADPIPSQLMRQAAFRRLQWEHRFDEHIAPINRLVDSLRDADGRGWMPYVAPLHDGVSSRMLSLLRDPGPATQQKTGSGFLCIQNADPTAEAQVRAFAAVGIEATDFLPWNAYPWYINRAPRGAELEAGVAVLADVVQLLPDMAVVLLQGRDAQAAWRRLGRSWPELAARRGLTVLSTFHPGRQALFHPEPAERKRRAQHRKDTYRATAGALRSTDSNE